MWRDRTDAVQTHVDRSQGGQATGKFVPAQKNDDRRSLQSFLCEVLHNRQRETERERVRGMLDLSVMIRDWLVQECH